MDLEAMIEMSCTYQGNRDEAILGHLYNDGDEAERAAFDAHVAGCSACSAELTALAGVRAQLAAWTPAEPRRALTHGMKPKTTPRALVWAALREVPVWVQVAAALLCVGIAAGVATLDVRYDSSGLSVRTGWMASSQIADNRDAATPVVPQAQVDSSAWRAELTSLERQLRDEFRAATAASS